MNPHAHTHDAGAASTRPDPAGGHGMVVVGQDTMFFSHLPMFMSPHHYQVIVEGTLSQPGSDPQGAYREDRKRHPQANVYTFNPAAFVLPDIFPPALTRKQFRGDLFRGHFESPPEFPDEPALLARGITVNISNVVYSQKLIPHPTRPDGLEYLLFGRGEELFLAHVITTPPDFDQILSVNVTGHAFGDDVLRRGVRVQMPGSVNSPAQRLKPGNTAAATARVSDKDVAFTINPGAELYFMKRELAEEATT